jgi:hypothetical protein
MWSFSVNTVQNVRAQQAGSVAVAVPTTSHVRSQASHAHPYLVRCNIRRRRRRRARRARPAPALPRRLPAAAVPRLDPRRGRGRLRGDGAPEPVRAAWIHAARGAHGDVRGEGGGVRRQARGSRGPPTAAARSVAAHGANAQSSHSQFPPKAHTPSSQLSRSAPPAQRALPPRALAQRAQRAPRVHAGPADGARRRCR